ncbi:MAG TPA: alpha-galactosidase [Planctomycetota bacterium]|nr:alpha-galactosidase [Planctomycetota bacterium]
MAKIAFIGAGSFGFTRGLVRDILTFPLLEDATLALMDIDAERLDFSTQAVKAIVKEGNRPAKVVSTTSRRKALEGADAVIVTILAGGVDVWKHDILTPKKFGVDTNIGDTRGPSGIFRALRTIPVMVDICRDMEKYCPNAIMLNYTNPMAMLCKAMLSQTSVKATGLCHSVQGLAPGLAQWIGAPADEITSMCAGINHLSWLIEFKWNGVDAYPLLRKAAKKRRNYVKEKVRTEMFLAFGYYVTESSGHNSEYNAWFRKRPDLIKKYCTPEKGSGWNPGEYAYIVKHYQAQATGWKKRIKAWIKDHKDFSLKRGHEYAANIVNAYMGGEQYQFNGNVLNTGLVTNLPENCCVEVPVLATRRGFEPMYVGALPPQCAALTGLQAQIEDMSVEAERTGNAELVYQAICHDPLTAAVCSLDEIRQMVKAMFRQNKAHLPQFKKIDF